MKTCQKKEKGETKKTCHHLEKAWHTKAHIIGDISTVTYSHLEKGIHEANQFLQISSLVVCNCKTWDVIHETFWMKSTMNAKNTLKHIHTKTNRYREEVTIAIIHEQEQVN